MSHWDRLLALLAVLFVCVIGYLVHFALRRALHRWALQREREFMALASHELKSPLTVVRGYVETLIEHPDLPPATIQEIAVKMLRHCKRMEKVVRNAPLLADSSPLPRSRLQDCDLKEIVERCFEGVRSQYPDSDLSLQIQSGPMTSLYADPELLEQALNNLMENAVKYSKGAARIKVSVHPNRFNKTVISIADQGIGIPKEALAHIFDRFYAVNKTRSRELGGSGLGLAIVKSIVDKHRGKIEVSSIPGRGSTFTISLPQNKRGPRP